MISRFVISENNGQVFYWEFSLSGAIDRLRLLRDYDKSKDYKLYELIEITASTIKIWQKKPQ